MSPITDRPNDRFRILAIDGGGIRGLISALVLREIEARLNAGNEGEWIRVADRFHLVAGTSAGGLAALALTAPKGLRAADLVDFYLEDGPALFHRSLWRKLRTGWGLFGPKYPAEPVREAIERRVGNPPISQASRDLLVTSYDMHAGEPHFFKRWRALESAARDVPLAEAALSTSAAPTYFPSHDPGESGALALVDGGVFANDPAVAAIAEALGRAKDDPAELEPADLFLVSIGTGEFTVGYEQRSVRRWGALRWVIGADGPPILDTILGGVSDGSDYWAHMLLNHHPSEGVPSRGEIGRGPRYYRLQATLGEAIALDDASRENLTVVLPAAAEALIDERGAEIDEIVRRLRPAPREAQAAGDATPDS